MTAMSSGLPRGARICGDRAGGGQRAGEVRARALDRPRSRRFDASAPPYSRPAPVPARIARGRSRAGGRRHARRRVGRDVERQPRICERRLDETALPVRIGVGAQRLNGAAAAVLEVRTDRRDALAATLRRCRRGARARRRPRPSRFRRRAHRERRRAARRAARRPRRDCRAVRSTRRSTLMIAPA